MNDSWYEKNVMEHAREAYLSRFATFNVYWLDINGVRYSSDGEGRFVSDNGDEFDYFRQTDGEGFEQFLRDEIIPDDVTYLQHAWASLDLEAVFNGGLRPSDYKVVKSLDILYDGEV